MVTITLPSELERAVADEAARKGTTTEQLSLDVLLQRFISRGGDASPPAASLALVEQLDSFLTLKPGWNGYEAAPPNRQAVSTATSALIALQGMPGPDRLAPSAAGGVGITYRRGERKAYVECYNSGQVVLLLSNATAEQLQTCKIEPTPEGFAQLLHMIRDYLDAGSA